MCLDALEMALHPAHPSVGPCSSTSALVILHVLVGASTSSGCTKVASVRDASSPENFREYAGIRLPCALATGMAGVPVILSNKSFDHLSPGGLLLTVDTLNTPCSVDTKSSPDLMLNPKYTPSSQRGSAFPGISLVFGILNRTASPNSINFTLDLLPLII